ncbi:MAG: cyclase family protein [Boseongicola sp. SB0662_bin_57]|nr:cyclase family protein [Boseongicola sp. SB0662_bin_57]
MCDVRVMNKVKERMLSRRDVFAAGAAAAVATMSGAPPAVAGGHGVVVDMTHVLDDGFPTYFGTPGITISRVNDFAEDGFNAFALDLGEHAGTHVDAPLHFSEDGQAVNEIPARNLVCPLCVVDVAARAADDPDTQVTPDDLSEWIGANGEIPDGACVAMHSGWAGRAGGDGFRNADDGGVMHFPGFHAESARMLIEETGAVAMAVDTLSLDHGPSRNFATHHVWLPSNRYGIECLAGLDRVPAFGATLVVGAPKHRGGSGGPARVLALV